MAITQTAWTQELMDSGFRLGELPCLPSHGSDDNITAWCGEESVTQTLSLSSGTNWVSFYVETELDDLKAALVAALPDTEITIKGRNQTIKYKNGRWTGQLTELDLAQMYKITVSAACEIELEGMPVDPSTLTLAINANEAVWMAFPYTESMTVASFFGTFPANNDAVKSKEQNSRYQNGRWAGQLGTLVPGQGYIYKSAVTEDRTFTFPANAK